MQGRSFMSRIPNHIHNLEDLPVRNECSKLDMASTPRLVPFESEMTYLGTLVWLSERGVDAMRTIETN